MSHDLIQLADDLLLKLSSPISPSDAACGWSEKSMISMKKLVSDARLAIVSNRPYMFISVGKWLDAYGIIDGDLLNKLCAFSNAVNDYSKAMQP